MYKVSVVIPIYNVEKYIEECLVSVMNQTLREIEIICVNDGTKDNSMEIVNRYAATDNRIVVVNKENGGLSSARNAGIDIAQGEYIYFIDSDDYIAENTLEILYTESKKDDLDVLYFDAESFFETEELELTQKHYKDYYRRPSMFQEVVSGVELFTKMENLLLYRPSVCLQIIKRSLIQQNELRFYEGILHEDNLFSLLTIFSAKKVKHMAAPFYKRRVRETSIMTGDNAFKRSYGYYICISEFIHYLERFNFENPDTIKAINHRCYVMQSNAAKCVKNVSLEELDRSIAEYPMQTQIEYAYIVRRLVEERQYHAGREAMLKEKSANELAKVKNSVAYRFGRTTTVVPQKIYHFVQNLGRKGFLCTMYGIKRKLTNEENDLKPNKICVSVIIPMYNAEKYLRGCLDLLLRQTLKSIEIICVNDGSTDQTKTILEEYADKDSRVKIVNQENQGAGIARNNGMLCATGEYYLFLDADDIFNEKLCEEAYYKAKYDMAEIVLFEAFRLNVQTHDKEEMNWVLRENLIPEAIPFSAKDTNNRIFQITTACPWSKMFKASFVKKHGLLYQDTKNANDVFFTRSALALAKRITVLKKRLITYRYNDGTNTQSRKNKYPIEFYKAFKALKEDLIRRGIYEKVEQSYVNMVLTESLFNLRTAGDEEAQQIVRKLLLTEGFDFFEFEKYGKEYFYNQKEYEQYKELLREAE